MQKIKAEIHLRSIYENATFFVRPPRKLCAVVKANAYGHGAEEVVNALQGVADCFAVALIEEALAIQTAACGKDILIFTPPLTGEEVVTIAKNGWKYIPAEQLPRLYSDVLVEPMVKAALIRLNPEIAEDPSREGSVPQHLILRSTLAPATSAPRTV